MADFMTVAQQFVTFYYHTFDSNRKDLGPLYRDQSMLTFETNQSQTAAAIVEKLVSLPFEKTQHKISTLDAQPASEDGKILVMVTGALLIDDSDRPQNYSQVFQLAPDGNGSYFVFNDIFKLIYT